MSRRIMLNGISHVLPFCYLDFAFANIWCASANAAKFQADLLLTVEVPLQFLFLANLELYRSNTTIYHSTGQ